MYNAVKKKEVEKPDVWIWPDLQFTSENLKCRPAGESSTVVDLLFDTLAAELYARELAQVMMNHSKYSFSFQILPHKYHFQYKSELEAANLAIEEGANMAHRTAMTEGA